MKKKVENRVVMVHMEITNLVMKMNSALEAVVKKKVDLVKVLVEVRKNLEEEKTLAEVKNSEVVRNSVEERVNNHVSLFK